MNRQMDDSKNDGQKRIIKHNRCGQKTPTWAAVEIKKMLQSKWRVKDETQKEKQGLFTQVSSGP